MPYYKTGTTLIENGKHKGLFDLPLSPETRADHSGIYQCKLCRYEVVCVKNEMLPAATDKTHAAWGCLSTDPTLVKWYLIVRPLDSKSGPF